MTAKYGHGVALTCLHTRYPVSAQSPFTTTYVTHLQLVWVLEPHHWVISWRLEDPRVTQQLQHPCQDHGTWPTLLSIPSLLRHIVELTGSHTATLLIATVNSALSCHYGSAVFIFPHQRWHIVEIRQHSDRTILRSRIQILAMRPIIRTEKFRSLLQNCCANYWTTDLKYETTEFLPVVEGQCFSTELG